MKSDVPLDLLHYLVNMAVEHSDRTETLQMRERLLAVLRSPAPVGIDTPKRNVCENHYRSACGDSTQVVLQPGDLLLAKLAHAFELNHVDQSNEVDSFVIHAVPPSAFRVFPVTV